MKLRTLVKRGTLRATKTAAGVYEFDTADLDALRATLGGTAGQGVATRHTVAAAPTIPGPLNTVVAQAPFQAPHAPFADWLLAALQDSTRSDSGDEHEDEDDAAEESRVLPFWTASAAPMYPEGEPVVDPTTRVISYRPAGSSTSPGGAHAPGTVGALIAELQVQLATMQAQLAATTAAAEQWRTAWRASRSMAIAGTIMHEAANARASPMSVDAAWRAAGAAANALPDDQLANEAYALGVGRAVGNVAAARVAGAVWFGGQDLHGGDHDLARARMRRRRSSSPRW